MSDEPNRTLWLDAGPRRKRGVVCDAFGHRWGRRYGVFGTLRKCRRCWQKQELTNEHEIASQGGSVRVRCVADGTVKVVNGTLTLNLVAPGGSPTEDHQQVSDLVIDDRGAGGWYELSDSGGEWVRVTRSEWMVAEVEAGFISSTHGHPATAGFEGHGWRGRINRPARPSEDHTP